LSKGLRGKKCVDIGMPAVEQVKNTRKCGFSEQRYVGETLDIGGISAERLKRATTRRRDRSRQ